MALRNAIRTAPVTSAYLLVLFVTTWVLQTTTARISNRLLLEQSTNLHHLGDDPIRVLIGSAFWLSSGWELIVWAALFPFVLAPVERRLGSGRPGGTVKVGRPVGGAGGACSRGALRLTCPQDSHAIRKSPVAHRRKAHRNGPADRRAARRDRGPAAGP